MEESHRTKWSIHNWLKIPTCVRIYRFISRAKSTRTFWTTWYNQRWLNCGHFFFIFVTLLKNDERIITVLLLLNISNSTDRKLPFVIFVLRSHVLYNRKYIISLNYTIVSIFKILLYFTFYIVKVERRHLFKCLCFANWLILILCNNFKMKFRLELLKLKSSIW